MSNIHLQSAIAKYIGAKAVVSRVDEGVKITLSDYQGSTEEIIAEAIESIVTNDDGSLTFTLPNGSEITTESLTGPRGNGITSIEKTGTSGLADTYTITYDDGETETFTVTNGAAAGFGTVSASVDANHGTPSVTVTTSGEDTAKNFAFDFKNLQPASAWFNVAGATSDGIVTSENIAEAVASALEESSYIYIPAGVYTCTIKIERDCTVALDKDCYIKPADERPAIHFKNCKGHLVGGNVCYGTGEDDRSRSGIDGGFGIIRFENCTASSISNLKSPYSRYTVTVHVKDCNGFTLENSEFRHMLRAAMYVDGACKNVTVRNCIFEDSDTVEGQDYCYFVYTGVPSSDGSSIVEPVNGLIYENNLCIDSEDCALDTHGATDVIIRNNVILDTVNAITAYNDNNRKARPVGWKMRNILIENNYCESNKTIRSGSAYPHPYLFLGSSNVWKEGDERPASSEANAYATFDDYVNCIVRNNVFSTSNDFTESSNRQPIYFNMFSRNLVLENNIFDFHNTADATVVVNRSIFFKFCNNKAQNGKLTFLFKGSFGEALNNIGCKYDWTTSAVSYIKGVNGSIGGTLITPTVEFGDAVYSSGAKISKTLGVAARLEYGSAVKTFSISVSGGIATVDNNVYIPKLRLELDSSGTTSIAYVADVIDLRHFSIVNAAGNSISDGTYTATIATASYASL